MRFLLLAVALITANTSLLSAPQPHDDTPAHIATHKRVPTWQSITNTISDAWNWITGLFSHLFSQMVVRNVPPLLKELYATRVAREKKYATTYTQQDIPEDLARIAGTLDRMEEDYKICRAHLAHEIDATLERSLLQEIDRIDDEVDDYMEHAQPLIEKYEQKAFSQRKTKLFKFLQILQSRSFIVEMLAQ